MGAGNLYRLQAGVTLPESAKAEAELFRILDHDAAPARQRVEPHPRAAAEQLHGSPGAPAAWINVMELIPDYLQLLNEHKAAPAVLVMPDTDGGRVYSLQCLNYPHGLQDMTYIGRDVPDWIAARLRVQKPGPAWGIAGYSEGGYCAANIGLQDRARFGFVAALSGYFAPIVSQIPVHGHPETVNAFQHYPQLATLNSPDEFAMQLPIWASVPKFFLAAGAADPGDVVAAQSFRQELLLRNATVPIVIVQGAGHQATVWRAALTPMLEWMTPQLAREVGKEEWLVSRHHRHHRQRASQTVRIT